MNREEKEGEKRRKKIKVVGGLERESGCESDTRRGREGKRRENAIEWERERLDVCLMLMSDAVAAVAAAPVSIVRNKLCCEEKANTHIDTDTYIFLSSCERERRLGRKRSVKEDEVQEEEEET